MGDEFIKMSKAGETIEVSPLVVEDHKRLGWKLVEAAEPEVAEAPAVVEDQPKVKHSKK